MASIVAVVEGHGDELAVPILLRRILHEVLGRYDITVVRPIRMGRGKLVKAQEAERAVQLGVVDREAVGAALVLFDADDDDGPTIESVLEAHLVANTPVPTLVRTCVREYEAWLLGAKESLRGHQGIRLDAVAPDSPEGIRDAKGELQANMVPGRKYLETTDQAKLTAAMDLGAARDSCPSFARLLEGLSQLAAQIPQD
jgi:hypothetical protein